MLRNRFYYVLKPWVPVGLRRSIRRWFAIRKRAQVTNTWPILPGSERPPEGWPGWPDSKKFALILTHDVEGSSGLAKCRQLMQLEQGLGFRSSFNFIPEGDYRVSRELRAELQKNGFEVGIHDLHHDGKLYNSREGFRKRALRINKYAQEWGAVGFRAGFMLHNLEWFHDLNVLYDASTFDTDPFEPQPQGRGTIFPHWIPNPAATTRAASALNNPRGGYVELPYSLPQDSSLFLLFQERHPDIWMQKLDWVAKHGGMALVNVHPDYLQFEGESPSSGTFPAEIYQRFLLYCRERYGDSFWQALPKEVAAYTAQSKPLLRPRPKRVCMVAYSYYLSDARITRYAEALAERGDEVDVVALKRTPEQTREEKIGNVNLVRLQSRFGKNEQSRLSYLVPILRFLAGSTFWIARAHRRRPYDLIHVHNVPDFLVFATAFPRLTGAKVILDIHDILPEFYASKFGSQTHSAIVKCVKWLERRSAKRADHVIIANHLWLDRYVERTGSKGKCSVFINNVDGMIFRARPRTRADGKFIVIFPGGLQWHQGLDIAIHAFQKVSAEVPQAEFHIYGEGNMKNNWIALSQELGLADRVLFHEPMPVRKIADVMANADLGVVPKRADSFGNEAYSTKIMEFMSLGIPAVISSTKIDRYYFDDTVVQFFESGNPVYLARVMLKVINSPELRQAMVKRASKYAAANSWETRKSDYLNLVDSLIENQPWNDPNPAPHLSLAPDARSAVSSRPAAHPQAELAVK